MASEAGSSLGRGPGAGVGRAHSGGRPGARSVPRKCAPQTAGMVKFTIRTSCHHGPFWMRMEPLGTHTFETLTVSSPLPRAGSHPFPPHLSPHQGRPRLLPWKPQHREGGAATERESLGTWNFPGSQVAVSESIKIWVFVPSRTTAPASSRGTDTVPAGAAHGAWDGACGTASPLEAEPLPFLFFKEKSLDEIRSQDRAPPLHIDVRKQALCYFLGLLTGTLAVDRRWPVRSVATCVGAATSGAAGRGLAGCLRRGRCWQNSAAPGLGLTP